MAIVGKNIETIIIEYISIRVRALVDRYLSSGC